MTSVSQILLLLYGSPYRFTSIRMELRNWYLPTLFDQAFTRWAAEQDAESVAVLRSEAPHEEKLQVYFVRLWASQQNRWRYEVGHDEAASEHIVVVNGPHWWAHHEHERELVTNEGTPMHHARSLAQRLEEQDPALAELLDPCGIIPYLWLEPQETVTFLEREAIHVKGSPRTAVIPDESPALLRLGATDYEFLVDAQRGALLRWEAYLDGQAFAGWELLDVAFDLDIADDTFVIVPAPNTAIRRVTTSRPPQIAYW